MSDPDVLDRAFDALARDLARSPGPGAAAAVSTARKRRRTRMGAVALAALVVVGGGVALPRLALPEDGAAASGNATPFDRAALAAATEGWITDWEDWERHSLWGGGGFGAASCWSVDGQGERSAPQPTSLGTSRFVSHSGASAVFVVQHFSDPEQATSAQELSVPPPDTCGSTTTYAVDGIQVRHDSMAPESDSVGQMWLGDVWSVRLGTDRARLELVNDAGVADDRTAEDVAEALVAGLRSGWTQSGMRKVPATQGQTAQLPSFPDRSLADALAGWQSATRGRGTGIIAPCLGSDVSEGSVTSSVSGTPRGVSHELAGYEDERAGTERVVAMVEELRTCTQVPIDVRQLPNGVFLATYDNGDADGRGAVWLAEHGSKAGVIGVDGAARPMPAGVDEDVADVLHDWLRLGWQ